MKRNLLKFGIFIGISLSTFAYTYNSNIYPNRGFQLMRNSNYEYRMNMSGESGSSQVIETFYNPQKDRKAAGLFLGTTSNFVDVPNVFAGVTLGYEKYKSKQSSDRSRNYDLNTYLSYNYANNHLFIGGLGYSQGKHGAKKEYSVLTEYGNFINNNLYTYLGANYFHDDKRVSAKDYLNYRVGLTRYDIFEKFRFENNIEVNYDNKVIDPSKRGKANLEFSSNVGYYIYPDLLLNVKYTGIKNSKFYSSIYTIGFTHNF